MENKNKVYLQRVFDCDAEDLFNWLTQPELIAQWFGPEGFQIREVECDLVKNGTYRFSLYKGEDYRFTVTGQYLEIERPDFLKFSYAYEDLESRPASTVSFKLEQIDPSSTKLELVQEFEKETPDYATRTKAWEFMLERLSGLV